MQLWQTIATAIPFFSVAGKQGRCEEACKVRDKKQAEIKSYEVLYYFHPINEKKQSDQNKI